jgi:hypothetical protein
MGNFCGLGNKWGVIFNQSGEEIIYTLHAGERSTYELNSQKGDH